MKKAILLRKQPVVEGRLDLRRSIPNLPKRPYKVWEDRVVSALRKLANEEISKVDFDLSSGKHFIVKLADGATAPFRHFIAVFPKEFGKPSESELAEMAGACCIIGRRLGMINRGSEECYTISKNGASTGSVPDIEHFHIYLFSSREEKIRFYYENVVKAMTG